MKKKKIVIFFLLISIVFIHNKFTHNLSKEKKIEAQIVFVKKNCLFPCLPHPSWAHKPHKGAPLNNLEEWLFFPKVSKTILTGGEALHRNIVGLLVVKLILAALFRVTVMRTVTARDSWSVALITASLSRDQHLKLYD